MASALTPKELATHVLYIREGIDRLDDRLDKITERQDAHEKRDTERFEAGNTKLNWLLGLVAGVGGVLTLVAKFAG